VIVFQQVSQETFAPSDGEIQELQLGTAENDIPELKDIE
jgi:hypothetical protein